MPKMSACGRIGFGPRIAATTVACLLLALSGCGFHLRGSGSRELQLSKVFVQSQAADQLAAELRRQLGYSGVQLVPSSSDAEAVVTLSNERTDERVLSVDPRTGKAREYELGHRVDVTVSRPDGSAWVPAQTVDLSRDFTFDESSVLGKFGEESLLREEMRKDAAQTILRRLESIRPTQGRP